MDLLQSFAIALQNFMYTRWIFPYEKIYKHKLKLLTFSSSFELKIAEKTNDYVSLMNKLIKLHLIYNITFLSTKLYTVCFFLSNLVRTWTQRDYE